MRKTIHTGDFDEYDDTCTECGHKFRSGEEKFTQGAKHRSLRVEGDGSYCRSCAPKGMKYTATVGAKQAQEAQNWYDEKINRSQDVFDDNLM